MGGDAVELLADICLGCDQERLLVEAVGIEAIPLSPRLGDFNEDLHVFGLDALRTALRIQLAPEDVSRFLLLSARVV